MKKIKFPDEKLSGKVDYKKIQRVKREGVWMNDKFLCPLCFEADYDVIKCQLEKESSRPMRYTSKCRRCGTIFQYNKETPTVDWT